MQCKMVSTSLASVAFIELEASVSRMVQVCCGDSEHRKQGLLSATVIGENLSNENVTLVTSQ